MIKKCLWHIAGVGAMGTVLAASFSRTGQSVHLILKNEEQVATYEHHSLRLIAEGIDFSAHPPASSLQTLSQDPIDVLICCTKSYDVTALLIALGSRLTEHSMIVLIHNGVGVLDEIAKQLPHLRIISGVSTLGAYIDHPYTARAFLGGGVHLGVSRGDFAADEIAELSAAFTRAELSCLWVDNIHPLIWDKFAINCSINMFTVLFDCKNGGLLAHQALLKKITSEIAAVLFHYDASIFADTLFEKVLRVLEHTAGNYSSMYQDVLKNRKTEIDYLNQYLVRLADKNNVNIDANKGFLAEFHALEA